MQLKKNIMKKLIILIALHSLFLSCAQVYPLNTYSEVPNNAYIKDINNELVPYEGNWKGTWNNKTIFISFKKIKKQFNYNDNKDYTRSALLN